MAKEHKITITNGTGSAPLLNDTYSVTANVNGYDNSTISPSSVNVVEGTNEYTFTVSATGTLTLHVTENGTSTGTAVVGAIFKRCDSTGTEYGNEITTNSEGNAVFNNVPFASDNAPIIYYKQIASDGTHTFDNTLKNTTLTENIKTVEVENPLAPTRTITLNDANYSGLKIEAGELTLTN